MRHYQSSLIVPSLLAMLALPVFAAEEGGATVSTDNTAEPAQVTAADEAAAAPNSQAAATKYVQARAAYQAAHFVEARELIDETIRLNPTQEGAQALREDILAVLSVRTSRLQMAATWFRSMQDVKTQELAVRLEGLIEAGDRKMASGDYSGAELDYDRVDIGLRSFPYKFDWGDLPAQVDKKRNAAMGKARSAEVAKQAKARNEAIDESTRQSDLQEEALRNKVDELLRRAKSSMARHDYKRAEVDAWYAYELDRRRDEARDLYIKARQGGHEQFDDEYRDQRLENIARVHEEIHKALIPQNELLVYPEDWHARALRKPQELGTSKEEPWMAGLKDRLQQRITCDFSEQAFEEVITFLQRMSGVSFVLAPDVAAGGAPNVSLHVKDMRLDDILKWVCTLTQLNWAIDKQAIFVSKAPIQGSASLKMYDITDLVSPIRDFPGEEPGYNKMSSTAGGGGRGGGGGGGGGAAPSLFGGGGTAAATGGAAMFDPDKLKEFIQKSVGKGSWENPGISIDRRSTTLFVTQSPETHRQIDDLLKHLRNQQNLQVKLDVRLLDVRKGFFEEIGVEFRDPGPGTAGTTGLIQGAGVVGGQSIYSPDNNFRAPSGYARLNDKTAYVGNLHNKMPPNNYERSLVEGPSAQTRGMSLDLAYNPLGFIGLNQINAIFSAMEEENDAQIISQPELTVFNGQRANCTFVTQYSYIAAYDVIGFAFDPRIVVLQYGDILDVRPVVSSDRKYITLEMRPTSVSLLGTYIETMIAPTVQPGQTGNNNYSSFGGGLSASYNIELPNIELKALRSTVMLPDKGTLILGGYTKAVRQRTHSGIPFLSHIPFLGRLFSKNGVYDQNRRLFYMLGAEIHDLQEREKER